MANEHKRFELAMMAEELGGLPLPIEAIIALEATGAVVDLQTGAITINGDQQRIGLTVLGEAVAVAARAWRTA